MSVARKLSSPELTQIKYEVKVRNNSLRRWAARFLANKVWKFIQFRKREQCGKDHRVEAILDRKPISESNEGRSLSLEGGLIRSD